MRRSILEVELVRECLDNGGGEVLLDRRARGRPVPAARRVRLGIRMERDRAAACRLLDMQLGAVHGDVLHVHIRIGIVRRRDGIAVEKVALAAEIINIELVGIRRSRHIEDAAACGVRCREILHMACARELPERAGVEEVHVQIRAVRRSALPARIAAHPEVDSARVALGIVALPRGVGGVQTDVDDAVRIRAASRAEIAREDGLVRACARNDTSRIRHRVDVDPARLCGSP